MLTGGPVVGQDQSCPTSICNGWRAHGLGPSVRQFVDARKTRLMRTFRGAKLEDLSQASRSADSPSLILEYSLLHIYLSLLLGQASAAASELTLILRPSSTTSDSNEQDAMVSMSALKTALGRIAVNAGWAEDMGTKAIYGLVAKRVLRIDRRGREALVAFT